VVLVMPMPLGLLHRICSGEGGVHVNLAGE